MQSVTRCPSHAKFRPSSTTSQLPCTRSLSEGERVRWIFLFYVRFYLFSIFPNVLLDRFRHITFCAGLRAVPFFNRDILNGLRLLGSMTHCFRLLAYFCGKGCSRRTEIFVKFCGLNFWTWNLTNLTGCANNEQTGDQTY